MILRIDASAALPVYEQIRQQVTRMAMAGTLPVGARMPTIRQLASDLGIAKGTVARAYEILEASSVVESRGSRGTFVLAPPTVSVSDTESLDQAAEAFVVTARQSGASLSEAETVIKQAWKNLGDTP